MPASQPEPQPRRWSWHIGTVSGIGLYIHATFVLLLAWIVIAHLSAGHDLATIGRGLLLIASVFAAVVLHELGHALVARRFGARTRDITLYPIGGMARLERMPERPGQELLVAIVGPLINFALALAIYVGLVLTDSSAGGDPLSVRGSFPVQLMWINVTLGVFNLLPAFPMDGGRVLRATLALFMDRTRATVVAAWIARGLALVLLFVGLTFSPWLAVIALFVWLAAGQEAALEQAKTSLRGASVAEAMVSELETLTPELSIREAAARLASGFQHDFPVVVGGRVVGVLTRDDVMRGLVTRHPDATVGDLMRRSYPTAAANERLDSVLGRLPHDGRSVIVVEGERLVGLLDPEHVSALLAMRRAVPPPLA